MRDYKEEELYFEELNKQLSVPYSDEEKNYLKHLYKRTISSNDQRNQTFIELDDMDYITYYDRNFRNDIAYTRARKNPEERLIVTGTTKQKGKSLLAAILNYNLEPNIVAYDKLNNLLVGLGETMADLVKKSREIEDYDAKRPIYYREGLAQGTWYAEELWTETFIPSKTIKEKGDPRKVNSTKWDEAIELYEAKCTTRLIPGKKVFLGDIYQFWLENQPWVFTVDRITYEEAESIFGDWERWEYVSKKIVKFFDYASREQNEPLDGVEVIRYYDKFRNEAQILLNGVMMLKVGYPLTLVSPSGGIPLVKGDIEGMKPNFAISRSIPADTKFDQEILDDFIRTIVLKGQQSLMPPMVNNTNRILSRNIFLPGSILQNVNPDLIKPLIASSGINNNDVAVFELVKKIVDEKSVSPVFQGEMPQTNQTATAIIEIKKQQMMKLGLTIWGIVQFERGLAQLRISNILNNWTTPIDNRVDETKKKIKEIYRTVSLEGTGENGQPVNKIYAFSEEGAQRSPEQVMAEEDILSMGKKMPVRKVYLNPKELRDLKANWVISITPTEKDTSELSRTLFVERIAEGYNLFGAQAFNMPYLKQRWATMIKEDGEKLFAQQAPQMAQGMTQGMPQGEVSAQMTSKSPTQTTPSLNTLKNA